MLRSINDGDRLGRELDRVVVTVVTDLSRFGRWELSNDVAGP